MGRAKFKTYLYIVLDSQLSIDLHPQRFFPIVVSQLVSCVWFVGLNKGYFEIPDADINRTAELHVSVEQSATSHARLQSVTEHLQAEAENSSVWTTTKVTGCRCDVSVISGAMILVFSLTYLQKC